VPQKSGDLTTVECHFAVAMFHVGFISCSALLCIYAPILLSFVTVCGPALIGYVTFGQPSTNLAFILYVILSFGPFHGAIAVPCHGLSVAVVVVDIDAQAACDATATPGEW